MKSSDQIEAEGGPAFSYATGDPEHGGDIWPGMTLRDWFATFAPEPDGMHVASEIKYDHDNNPYNMPNKPPLRSRQQIRADARFAWADAMLAARETEKAAR